MYTFLVHFLTVFFYSFVSRESLFDCNIGNVIFSVMLFTLIMKLGGRYEKISGILKKINKVTSGVISK